MFSFMKIATFAALAFGTIASALPSPVASPDVHAIVARQAAAPDVSTILTNLNNDLQAPVAQMNALTPATATPDKVSSIVVSIQVIIAAAVSACGGKPAGSGDLIVLISVIINLVIGAFGKCHSAFPSIDISVFISVDVVLAALIKIVLGLVGGLLSIVVGLLVGLLGVVVNILVTLKFTACLKVLLII